MATIDIDKVGSDAAQKIIEVLTGAGRNIASFAEAEGRKLAMSASEIAALRLSGDIDDEELSLHIDIQKHASRAVLMAIAGVTLLAAEQAINAALTVVGTAIKTATGITLPG